MVKEFMIAVTTTYCHPPNDVKYYYSTSVWFLNPNSVCVDYYNQLNAVKDSGSTYNDDIVDEAKRIIIQSLTACGDPLNTYWRTAVETISANLKPVIVKTDVKGLVWIDFLLGLGSKHYGPTNDHHIILKRHIDNLPGVCFQPKFIPAVWQYNKMFQYRLIIHPNSKSKKREIVISTVSDIHYQLSVNVWNIIHSGYMKNEMALLVAKFSILNATKSDELTKRLFNCDFVDSVMSNIVVDKQELTEVCVEFQEKE